jgi:UDP-N-acetylmuramate: L-alanyl-gamma-D-glutamyl-meso-diaminopimelate ligase
MMQFDVTLRIIESMDENKLTRLTDLRRVHIIGVCGTLMGAFAAFLKRNGIEVSGSDQNVYPPMSDVLMNAGITIYNGYRAENLTTMEEKPDLVVIGNVISANNPEARSVIDGGYVYSSLPEAMERLMLGETRNLVVSGTHGKTTTSSLLAHVLSRCGKNPNYFIGGVSHDLPFSFNVTEISKGKYFVLEGDEYDTAFWDKVPKFNHYLPDDVILTSVEYDHADIYPDFAAVVRAFEGLIARVRSGGRLIACLDYPVIFDLLKKAKVPVLTYGSRTEGNCRYVPAKIRSDLEFTRFEVLDNGKSVEELSLRVPGHHNVLNSLAVWIQCRELGIPSSEIAAALFSFQGVKRRQEVRGEVRGVLVIDDFAHHPTAVRETLNALRARYSKRRLIAVFEPRSATSRRKIFQKEYAKAFEGADAVFIATPYDQSRIPESDQFSSGQLVSDINSGGKTARLMDSVDAGVLQVAEGSRPGDVIAVLSNGGFGGFITKLLDKLGS